MFKFQKNQFIIRIILHFLLLNICIIPIYSIQLLHHQRHRRSVNVIDVGKQKKVILVQTEHRSQIDTNTSLDISSALNDFGHLEEEDLGDSDVSEERNPEDLINSELFPVKIGDSEQQRPDDVVSIISSAFNNRKSFSCPKTKTDLVTGTTTENLSPEDIGIIAAMGDSLATGAGLWPRTDIEFRGAAFPIGGDATIDGLVTVPNILREFIPSNHLHGVSHGMGHFDELPEHQLNVAISGADSGTMPAQARELVRRIKMLKEVDTWNTWALVIITIGTEEVCSKCTGPNTNALIEAIDILNNDINKALIILLGPIHVSHSFHQKANLLKKRCDCSVNETEEFMQVLSDLWVRAFAQVKSHANKVKRKTFNVLALPMLTVHSRYPYSLFIFNKPLLNRRGHNYAAKWLWNRLIGGPKYNLSAAVLSSDAYFCPSLGCPYIRIPENYNYCEILTISEANRRKHLEEVERNSSFGTRFGSRVTDLYVTTAVIVCIALVTVLILATLFYQRSKKGSKGRFDVVLPHGPPANYRKATVRQPAPTLINNNKVSSGKVLLDEDQILLNTVSENMTNNSGNSGSEKT